MDSKDLTTWFAGGCGAILTLVNNIAGIFYLKIMVNWGDLFAKGLTAVVVGFIGACAGVLGKMFITWLRKKILIWIKDLLETAHNFFNKKTE